VNNQTRKADKEWPSSLEFGRRVNNPPTQNILCYDFYNGFFGTSQATKFEVFTAVKVQVEMFWVVIQKQEWFMNLTDKIAWQFNDKI
jgi:hypothetical protein